MYTQPGKKKHPVNYKLKSGNLKKINIGLEQHRKAQTATTG